MLRDQDIETHANNHEEKGRDDHAEMQDEPIVIYHHLINWSSTCVYFRNLLAPDIFKTTKLVNKEKSGSSLNALATGPHSVHVKSLHFVGSALGDAHSEEAAFSDIEGILPHSVDALICDLQRFPSLERLSIKFDYNFESYQEWAEGMDITAQVETPDQVLEAEASAAWRALMSRTYSALIQNKSPHFKHLEIRQLIWKTVSTFSDAAFHDFLSHLEQFTLTIHGEDNGAGWKVNKTEEYPALMGKLDEYFFNHLANVTTLSIKAPEEGPLGLVGMNHAPLALEADQMPLLTILHLDHIFASPALVDFLVGHKNTLEELILRNCYASAGINALAENGIYWSEFFSSLFSVQPTHLRHFELVGNDMPFPSEGTLDKEASAELHATLEQIPDRILFPYMILDDKYGMLFYDDEQSLEAFSNGEDQTSWNRLMGLVERNAKEAMKK